MKSNYAFSLDGAKIAYNVSGQGPALLLLHGLGAYKEMWVETGWTEILQKYFTIIAMDIRGNGESDKSYDSNFYTINNIINDINIVISECGFKEYSFFGHSYGATIGLQLCKCTKNVNKAICAGTMFGDKFFKEMVPKSIYEYEDILSRKKNNTLDELNLTMEDIEWIETKDFELAIAQYKALNKWVGVEVEEIATNLAVYSGTNDNPQVLQNLIINEDKIKKNNITFKIFENLHHGELVSKTSIISPWALEFFLK